ncbi:glycogen synthase GlgA [bacterium]|nr:glycogen synthase GlgA [bacterium]
MQEKRNILMVASEVVPFAKTGGLADVCGALPKALQGLGHDVRLLMPLYKQVDVKEHRIRRAADLKNIPLKIGSDEIHIDFRTGKLPDSKVKTYFLDYDEFYNRDELYVDPETGKDYPDNDRRFIALSRAAFALCESLDWIPDVIHCHDWQTALIPLLINSEERFTGTRTVLTIHNLGYQGNFPPETTELIGDYAHLMQPMGPMEYYGKVSFLKTGILFANKLNAVSPTYAREIQGSEEYGYGFQGILQERAADLVGILNGLDVDIWNPRSDSDIAVNYDVKSLDKKIENKKALCERVGFTFSETVPLFGVISRLADQKGFDLFAEIEEALVALPFQFVLLGTGDKKYEELFRQLAQTNPKKFHTIIGFNNKLAHRIEAGVDCFMMPSRYEPCGLNQMMSMRYGTVPLVRATGGLADTVIDIDAEPKRGNGFTFDDYDSELLLKTIERAVKVFEDQSRWKAMQERGMKQDFSWKASAKKYGELYEQALHKS